VPRGGFIAWLGLRIFDPMPAGQDESDVRAVKSIIATIYSAQNALRALAPEYNWAGLGNLLGDYGEFVTTKFYHLKKGAPGADGFDARTLDGKSVQVKTNHAANQIGFRGTADLLLVVKVDESGAWEELYYGDFASVQKEARRSERDNNWMISVSKLRTLQSKVGRPPGAPPPPA
jgi:hypothetical protein